jgi:hypothetical protein
MRARRDVHRDAGKLAVRRPGVLCAATGSRPRSLVPWSHFPRVPASSNPVAAPPGREPAPNGRLTPTPRRRNLHKNRRPAKRLRSTPRRTGRGPQPLCHALRHRLRTFFYALPTRRSAKRWAFL